MENDLLKENTNKEKVTAKKSSIKVKKVKKVKKKSTLKRTSILEIPEHNNKNEKLHTIVENNESNKQDKTFEQEFDDQSKSINKNDTPKDSPIKFGSINNDVDSFGKFENNKDFYNSDKPDNKSEKVEFKEIFFSDTEHKYPTNLEKKQEKKKLKRLKKIIIILELIFTLCICLTAISELIIATKLFTNYTRLSTSYLYEIIGTYTFGLSYKFKIKNDRSPVCDDGFLKFSYQQIATAIKGICVSQGDSGSINVFYPKYSFECDNSNLTEIDVSSTFTINYWSNFYYCRESYSQDVIKMNFRNDTCELLPMTGPNKTQINCGNYAGYNLCMDVTDVRVHVTDCPYFTFIPSEDPLSGSNNKVSFGAKTFDLINRISENNPYFQYVFNLDYGNITSSYEESDLESVYTNYYKKQYLDLTDNIDRLSILPNIIDTDTNLNFDISIFQPLVTQYLQKLNYNTDRVNFYPTKDQNNTIENFFSIRSKKNILPDPSVICFENFIYDPLRPMEDYVMKFNLFLSHLAISCPRLIGFTILELCIIFIVSIYFRGFLIYKELTGKISPLDEVNEEVGGLVKNMASFYLIIVKFFTNYVQTTNIGDNIDFAKKMVDNNCFIKDLYFHKSLILYVKDVEDELKYLIDLITYILIIHFVLDCGFMIIERIYFRSKNNFKKFEKLYKIGLEIKGEELKKKRTSKRKEN